METTTPWSSGRPTRSSFAVPRGLPGRIAGRMMLWMNRQEELLDLLDIQDGQRVLEVGYGPGGLVRLLGSTPAQRISGVDPSPEMRDLATRRNREEIAAGRIELRLGTAERTGFPDSEFDRVVSVNTVAIWPDLEAGLRELHRVTRRGGRVLIAWHGGSRPSRMARGLALPPNQLDRVERGLGDLFTDVTRQELSTLTVFVATR